MAKADYCRLDSTTPETELVSRAGQPMATDRDSIATGHQDVQSFERQSRKFWVKNDQKRYVQAVIRQHLPVRRRGVIHSIYLDANDKAMYLDRLISREGAQLVRFRWYGDDTPKTVYVEIKTHHSKGISTKQRFPLAIQQAKQLLRGEAPWEQGAGTNNAGIFGRAISSVSCPHEKFLGTYGFATTEQAQGEGGHEEESYAATAEMEQSTLLSLTTGSSSKAKALSAERMKLAECVLALVRKGMQSSIRTEYYRTAYEDEGEARYRVSLDESVSMAREESLHERDSWSVVHTSAAYAGNAAGNAVENADGGPGACNGNGRRHDCEQQSAAVVEFPYCVMEVKVGTAHTESGVDEWVQALIDEGSIIEAKKFSKYLTGCSLLYDVPSVPSWVAGEVGEAMRQQLKRQQQLHTNPARFQAHHSPLFHEQGRSLVNRNGAENGSGGYSAGTGTSSNVTVIDRQYKAEPKSFMANERTFLSWMRSFVPLATIGLCLLRLNLWAEGLVIVLLSMTGVLYAAYRYRYRHRLMLQKVSHDAYHDRYAVAVITLLFCVCMALGVVVQGATTAGHSKLGSVAKKLVSVLPLSGSGGEKPPG